MQANSSVLAAHINVKSTAFIMVEVGRESLRTALIQINYVGYQTFTFTRQSFRWLGALLQLEVRQLLVLVEPLAFARGGDKSHDVAARNATCGGRPRERAFRASTLLK